MRKIAGALAVLLVLSHAASAGAAPAAGEQPTCTRQAAIWQRLFQDGDTSGALTACRSITNWFGEQGRLNVVEASADATTAPTPAPALLVPSRPVALRHQQRDRGLESLGGA
jgi:hypothetical protein